MESLRNDIAVREGEDFLNLLVQCGDDDTLVLRVRDQQLVIGGDKHTQGFLKAEGSSFIHKIVENAGQCQIRVQHHDPIVVAVQDVDVPFRVDGHVGRFVPFSYAQGPPIDHAVHFEGGTLIHRQASDVVAVGGIRIPVELRGRGREAEKQRHQGHQQYTPHPAPWLMFLFCSHVHTSVSGLSP